MKVSVSTHSHFTPFTIDILVESEHEAFLLKTLVTMNVTVPKALGLCCSDEEELARLMQKIHTAMVCK